MKRPGFKSLLLALICVGTSAIFTQSAFAQVFPSRPIRLIVPFPPGGSADAAARLVAQHASLTLGQPVTVENRAGAAGNLGAEAVARAPADGYTLLYGVGSIFTNNPWLYKDMRVDPLKDFAPLTLVNAGGGFVLVTHPGAPYNSLQEFVDYVRKHPGKINFASYGSGSAPHLVMEMLKADGGLFLTHIPYRGAAPAMTAVLGQQVDVMFDTLISTLPQIRAGKLKPLAVTTAKRMVNLPEVPAVSETFSGFEAEGWHGVFAPAGTPRDVQAKLDEAMSRAVKSSDVARWLQENGLRAGNLSLNAFATMVRVDNARWGRIVQAGNIKPE